jgi:predicted metal-dependent phosphoesterase TrpH
MFYDLHVHTSASDGEDTPETVILRAIEAGLGGLAITDHDTVDGLEPAGQFIMENRLKIDLIPGIELNTDYGQDDLHILGYYVDYNNGHLRARLSEIRGERYARAEKMIGKLQGLGINIDFDQVKKIARGNLIGRPHIARALCSNGYANTPEEAFRRYIVRGQPAFVPRYKFSPAEAIALVKKAGGIAVLAHPGLIRDKAKIFESIKLGIEGLEIYYPKHSEEQQRYFL